MPTAAACRIHKPPRGASERRSRLGLWKPSKAKCFAVSKSRALEEALRVAPGRYGKYRGNRHAVRPVTRMCDLRHRIAVECGVNLHLSEDGSVIPVGLREPVHNRVISSRQIGRKGYRSVAFASRPKDILEVRDSSAERGIPCQMTGMSTMMQLRQGRVVRCLTAVH
jgi:hypothetical protein